MKIYTKTGDDGTTGLMGGDRVSKDNPRIEAYGTVDELNSILGVVRALAISNKYAYLSMIVQELQVSLFILGSDLATPLEARVGFTIPRIEAPDIKKLEMWIDENVAELSELKQFILPGGTELAAQLHVARTVARRAERLLITLKRTQELGAFDLIYLNRLSDLLFVLARRANQFLGIADIEWDGRKHA
ncbi:MAG: cob(I)yrinic acid a,c-diamide adenosyltransferase [Candidatus Kapaibacterium sp.]